MKGKILIIILIVVIIGVVISVLAVNSNEKADLNNNNDIDNNMDDNINAINNERTETYMIKLSVNNTILNIKPEDNVASIAFIERLKQGEITVKAEDYGDFEKVGSLGFSLPTNDTKITTEAGDLILYQGNQIVLHYDTNTWIYTKLGKVQDIEKEELKEILGSGDVIMTFTLDN